MTTVYFVRHAEPNYLNHNDAARELTPKGQEDRKRITAFFDDTHVDVILSSPYKRAVDTVSHLANSRNMEIILVDDFRERKVDSGWIENFAEFCQHQWQDFHYKLSDGETLHQVQKRNIAALSGILTKYQDKTIVIGSHGTALSTIINFYNPAFGFQDFNRIKHKMPWIAKLTFQKQNCLLIEEIDILSE